MGDKYTGVWAAVLSGLVLCAACGCLDQRFVYFPSPWEEGDWAARAQLPLEDVWFTASDGVKLHGWFISAPGSHAVVLWCHGNAGNVIHRLAHAAPLYQRGISVFLFDYRGYGRSRGTPSEPGLARDALAAYNVLVEQRGVPPERIVLFGESLGAAVAGDLAAQRRCAGLILESPFPSVAAVARAHYGLPLNWLLRARYPLAERLPRVHAPVLVLHGDRDDIIPLALGRRVFEAARQPKDWYLIAGAGHNDTFLIGGSAYFDRLAEFIRSLDSPVR